MGIKTAIAEAFDMTDSIPGSVGLADVRLLERERRQLLGPEPDEWLSKDVGKMYYVDDRMTLYHGDAIDVLRSLPDGLAQCCMTSPPYFALRSYLAKDDPLKSKEIGSEPTPEAFIATMVDVFREVRRVLRDDGVCFVNLGDSYRDATKWGGRSGNKNATSDAGGFPRLRRSYRRDREPIPRTEGGQLQNMPHRVAEALRQDGWIWRQTIIWAKRSPMPESVSGWRWVLCRQKAGRVEADWQARPKGWQAGVGSHDTMPGGNYRQQSESTVATYIDCPWCPKCEAHGGYVLRRGSGRCTTAHEYVFVFAKSARYFWDGEASKEPQSDDTHERFAKQCTEPRRCPKEADPGTGIANNWDYAAARRNMILGGRNPRSVWMLSAEPTKVRHFATFPSELVRRCLIAGCSAGGCCPNCGAPWAPVVDSRRVATRPALNNKMWKHADGDHVGQRSDSAPNLDPERHLALTTCLGYRPTCDCIASESARQVVLDPFNGIGTTGQTAVQLGHNYVGIDLNREYLDVSIERIHQPPRWWLRQQQSSAKKAKPRTNGERLLF